jgi:hypothetical protein
VETVILTATIQLNDAVGEATKQFTITVAALIMTNYDTTLEVKGEVDGTTVEINGIISYVNEKGIFVHDATGDIYVYLGATHAYTVGTEVTVAGTKSTYIFLIIPCLKLPIIRPNCYGRINFYVPLLLQPRYSCELAAYLH